MTDEQTITQLIEERDAAQDVADKLANAVAELLDLEIGEHSNLNDPWLTALVGVRRAIQAQDAVTTWHLPAEPTDVTAVRDRDGDVWVAPGRPHQLWWKGELGRGIGFLWHELLQNAGPLTVAEAVTR